MPVLFFGGCALIDEFGGAFDHEPEDYPDELSDSARALVDEAFADFEGAEFRDFHVHIFGNGTAGIDTWTNPRLLSVWHPIHRLKSEVYLSGADVDDLEEVDVQYVERLVRLARGFPYPAKFHLLAFDYHYEPDGTRNLEDSEFYVPNDRVMELAAEYPDVSCPSCRLHPYREDALEELARLADAGARFVKWLPNAQGMDPSDGRIDPYYQLMAKRGMALLTHTGEEQAVEAEEDQALGNPLLLRHPLDHRVPVIVAHCASLGESADLDAPGDEKPMVPSYTLFLRLMDEERYDGLLFGEISAMTQANRLADPLVAVLRRPDLHDRIVNGSDYPLPCDQRRRADAGAVLPRHDHGGGQRDALNEIYDVNPLLFDFVLKRVLRDPETGNRLPAGVFTGKPFDSLR